MRLVHKTESQQSVSLNAERPHARGAARADILTDVLNRIRLNRTSLFQNELSHPWSLAVPQSPERTVGLARALR